MGCHRYKASFSSYRTLIDTMAGPVLSIYNKTVSLNNFNERLEG